jgi:hypothetical protein
MLKDTLLQTKLSKDVVNIILKYELNLDNLDRKLKIKKYITSKTVFPDFSIEKITSFLQKALGLGYYGYILKFSNNINAQLQVYKYLDLLIRNNNLDNTIKISYNYNNDNITISLKSRKLEKRTIIDCGLLGLIN